MGFPLGGVSQDDIISGACTQIYIREILLRLHSLSKWREKSPRGHFSHLGILGLIVLKKAQTRLRPLLEE